MAKPMRNGRTTCYRDATHKPLDLIILMLGPTIVRTTRSESGVMSWVIDG
jgi:hypothetical protein